jgi:hypothetical protein
MRGHEPNPGRPKRGKHVRIRTLNTMYDFMSASTCPPEVVAQSDIDAKAVEECGADRTDFPEPTEEYGPGRGDEEREETR